MSNFVEMVAKFTRPFYVKWPLLLIVFVAMPKIILILPWYGENNFTYSQLNLWLILSVTAIGLNILTGLTGMISLGHSAVFAVGAYVAGYCVGKASLPYVVAIIIAAIGGGLIGLLLGLPALRLSGTYLAVATFGFAVAVPQLLSSSKELGELFADPNDISSKIGVFKVPKQVFPGFEVRNDLGRYYLFLVIVVVMILLAGALWNSRTGRAFRAIRDSETAAQAMGINISNYKVLAFIISSMFAGVAGSMYSAQVGQIESTDLSFSAIEAILFLTAIILGGLGSITGAVLGAGVLTMLPNATSQLARILRENYNITIENFESILYGLIIILCVFYMPNGLAGAFRSLFARMRPKKNEEVSEDEALPDVMAPAQPASK